MRESVLARLRIDLLIIMGAVLKAAYGDTPPLMFGFSVSLGHLLFT